MASRFLESVRAFPGPGSSAIVVVALALLATLLNALKPLHMDDTFILRVAEQIARSPLDPYGFDIFWSQWPQPAYEELTPPVLPYWWALGLHVLPSHPVFWKLWMFPFNLLFCASLWAILVRFAPGLEMPLLVMTALSVAFLPSTNLMQDVPAMALGLTALAVWLSIGTARSGRTSGPLPGALVVGLIAGLSLQTKYTMVTILGAILLHGILWRRFIQAVLALAVALTLFGGWEYLMTLRYGQGMLLGQLKYGLFWWPRGEMILPLVRLLGGTLPFVAILALGALGLPRPAVLALGAGVLAGLTSLLAFASESWLYPALGALSVSTIVLGCGRLLLRRGAKGFGFTPESWRVTGVFLALWLAGEVAVYFASAPFPAVRRVMGIVIVGTVAVGHLSAAALRGKARPLPVTALSAAAVIVGLGVTLVDTLEAFAQKRAVASAARAIRRVDPRPNIWFVGHWGFQYYAEESGMKPVVPDHSLLKKDDWLVVPTRVSQQAITLSDRHFRLHETVVVDDPVPMATSQGFYGGSAPVSHLRGPRVAAAVFRVVEAIVPPSSWTPEQLASWALDTGGLTAAAAVPAMARLLVKGDVETRKMMALVLVEVGPRASVAVPALVRALEDPVPGVRKSAAEALGRIGGPALSAEPALRRALTDPQLEVRRAADRALRALGGG